MAFEELSLSSDGLVPWSRLEELFLKLEVKPKAIQLCRHLVDAEGLVDSAELFRWLYDGEDVSPYHEGRRLHERVPPCRWCISRCDFQDFVAEVVETHRAGRILNQPNPRTKEPNPFHDDEHVGPNMHAVNEAVIRPRTARAGGMSWALMLSPEGLSGEFFFVTHSWKEGVYEFSRKVLNHWQDEALSMWCCFLANPQTWQREDLNQLLGQSFDLMDSPFMQALSSQQLHSFVVVPNVTESLYCRLWCVAELWKAMEVQKLRGDGRMIQVAKDNVKDSHKVRPTEIATLIHGATCSDVNDEKRIRAYIAGKEQHIQEMIKDLAGMKKSKKTHHSLSHEQERRKTEEELRYREKERGRKEHQERHATSEVVVCPHPQMEERIVQSLGGEDLIIEEDQQREVVVERHARHPRRSAAPRAPSTSDVHEERRQQVLEDRIRQVRAQVEQQRLEETRVEHTLMTRVEDLERQLQHRRQSIVHRISREQEREENLRKYLRYLEDADLEDLRREIRLRKDSALLKEETLRQQLEHLLPSPPSPKGERGHREERLERQIALRRQLETLETSEGSDSVRRHLLALKQAEMMEFQREVQLHRMEDEAKELPMRQQLEELHEEWQRFRVQCEHERQAAEMQEEQILLEMSSLTDHRKRQEQDMSPDTSKERRSKSRQALGARSSSEGGKASGRGLELERRDPVPSSHWGSQELDLTPQHNVVGPPIHLEDGPGRHSGPPGGASRGRSDQEDLSPQSARSGTDVTPVVSQSRSVVSGQESEDEADESDDDLLFI